MVVERVNHCAKMYAKGCCVCTDDVHISVHAIVNLTSESAGVWGMIFTTCRGPLVAGLECCMWWGLLAPSAVVTVSCSMRVSESDVTNVGNDCAGAWDRNRVEINDSRVR